MLFRSAGPIVAAATWINQYTEYWQAQFDTLAALVTAPPDNQP